VLVCKPSVFLLLVGSGTKRTGGRISGSHPNTAFIVDGSQYRDCTPTGLSIMGLTLPEFAEQRQYDCVHRLDSSWCGHVAPQTRKLEMGALRADWRFYSGRDFCRILQAARAVAENSAAKTGIGCLSDGDLRDAVVSSCWRWRRWQWNQQFRHNPSAVILSR
jgi:hypothetical protein